MEVVGLVVVDHPADKALAVVDRQAVVVVVAGQEVVVDPLVAVVGQVVVDHLVAADGQVVVDRPEGRQLQARRLLQILTSSR